MKIKNIISFSLGSVALFSVICASAVPDSAYSFSYELPFYIIAIISGLLAIMIYYWNSIRRMTYPALICGWAWLYKHKLAKSEFSCHTYRVYVFFGSSYRNLYRKVQSAFDQYMTISTEV